MAATGTLRGPHLSVVRPTANRQRWVALCSCGYVSTTRLTKELAVEAAEHHLRKTLVELRRFGLAPDEVSALVDRLIRIGKASVDGSLVSGSPTPSQVRSSLGVGT